MLDDEYLSDGIEQKDSKNESPDYFPDTSTGMQVWVDSVENLGRKEWIPSQIHPRVVVFRDSPKSSGRL